MINPQITLNRRSELLVVDEALAMVVMFKVPYLFDPNGMIWLDVVKT